MKNKRILKCMIAVIVILVIGGVTLGVMQFVLGKKMTIEISKTLEDVSPEISDIFYYAAFAPNSHNAQMWSVTLNQEKQTVHIQLDKQRTLEAVDSENREAYLSLGAYTENLMAAFKAYGYQADFQIVENVADPVILLNYREGFGKTESLLDIISKRHTDKGKYKNEPIQQEAVDDLIQSCEGLHYYAMNSAGFDAIQSATLAAGEQQSNNQDIRNELADWLRFSDKEAQEEQDGLPAEQLGLGGLKKAFYYLFTNRDSAQGDTFAKQGNDTMKQQLANCGGFFVLTGSESHKENILTGMKLQRFWLKTTEYEIAVHPMSFILEEELYKHEIVTELNLNQPVQMILRVGYVEDYGENNKIRRDLSKYITVE